MKTFPFITFLLALFVSVVSCKGQSKTNLPAVPQISFTGKQTKMVKTQGTDAYQNVHCGLQDKAGNLWFGTTGEGVYCYDGKMFTQYTTKDGLSDNRVWSVLEDRKGNIWFGTGKGISRYDGKTISAVPIVVSGDQGLFPVFSMENPSAENSVYSILQDKNGTLWFGTDNGVYCYNGQTFTPFLGNPLVTNKSGMTLKSVQCMFEDKDGNIWFGSGPMAFEGIGLYNARLNDSIGQRKSLVNFKPKNENWIRAITADTNGIILLATRHFGLMTYDGKSFSDYQMPQGAKAELINTILPDSKGHIWYGSDYVDDADIATGGVWKSDGKSFTAFTPKDGLTNTATYFFMEDKAGNTWIGTRNTGLYRYDGKTFTCFSE